MSRYFNPFPQSNLDSNKINSGGKIFFFDTGTENLRDTFSDKALSVPNTNPLVLDSAGRLKTDVFLSPVLYRVRETNADESDVLGQTDEYGGSTAPGDSVGTLDVQGNFTVDALGGTILIEGGASQTLGGAWSTTAAFTGTQLVLSGGSNTKDGTTGSPAYSFTSSTNSGIFLESETALNLPNILTTVLGNSRGMISGRWNVNDTDITGLIPGSTGGSLWLADNAIHAAVALRDDATTDSFSIISGGGNWDTDETWDTLVFHAMADGDVSVPSGDLTITTGKVAIGTPTISSGSGTPEGVVTAPIGSMFMRTDGGAGTSHYIKESGTGNTGWIAK